VDKVSVKQLEFWPEYGAGPLWDEGAGVDPTQLGLPTELVERLVAWNARYGDERLPMAGPGDPDWLGEGRRLLAETRTALEASHRVVVTEPWWGEEPLA
jgi:hypothetical protein